MTRVLFYEHNYTYLFILYLVFQQISFRQTANEKKKFVAAGKTNEKFNFG